CPSVLGDCLTARGLFNVYLARYQEAISDAQRARSMISAGTMSYGYSFYVAGQAEHAMGLYQDALADMEKSIAELEKLETPYWLHHAQIATAQLYGWLGNIVKARDLYQRGIAGAETIGNTWVSKAGLLLLGDLDLQEGNLDSARALFEESLHMITKMDDRRSI